MNMNRESVADEEVEHGDTEGHLLKKDMLWF